MLFELFPHLTSEKQFGGVNPAQDEKLLRSVCERYDINLAIHLSSTRTLNLKTSPVIFHHINNDDLSTVHLLCLSRSRPFRFVYIKNIGTMKSLQNDRPCNACDSIVCQANIWRHRKLACPNYETFLATGVKQPFKTEVNYICKKYEPRRLLGDYLEFAGLDLETVNLFYPFLMIFDTESLNAKPELDEKISGVTERTALMSEHKLCAISATSNVPNYTTPQCWVVNPGDTLSSSTSIIEDFVAYALKVAAEAEKQYLKQIDSLLTQIEQRQKSARLGDNPKGHSLLSSCEKKLRNYAVQLPVMGFNSSS